MQNLNVLNLLCYIFFQLHPQSVPVVLPVFQSVNGEMLEITESLARTRGEASEGIPIPSIWNARVRKSTQQLCEEYPALHLNKQAHRGHPKQCARLFRRLCVYF